MAPDTRHWKTFWRHDTSCAVAPRLSFSHKMPGIMSNSWCCVLDVIPVRKRKANVYSIFFRYIFHIYLYLKILVKTKKWSPWKCSFNSNIDTFVFSYCSKTLLLCSWNYFLILLKKCLFLFWARFNILIKYVYLTYISFVDSNTYTPSTRNKTFKYQKLWYNFIILYNHLHFFLVLMQIKLQILCVAFMSFLLWIMLSVYMYILGKMTSTSCQKIGRTFRMNSFQKS